MKEVAVSVIDSKHRFTEGQEDNNSNMNHNNGPKRTATKGYFS